MANLAAPIDASVLGQAKNFTDVMRGQQQAQLTNQAAQLDNQTKANVYKTQVLSAAAGSGDQGVYSTALQHLAENGIDISDVPQDINTGAQYAQAGRLAQSPLGTLLNAAQKQQSNDIALGSATGTLPAGAYAPSIPGLNLGGLPINIGQANPQTIGKASPQAVMQTTSRPVINQQIDASASATPIPAQPQLPVTQLNSQFNPPSQNPNETNAAYQSRVQHAFEAYKADPEYLRTSKAAETTGELNAKDSEAAKKADELTKRLDMNLQAMEQLNPDVPSSGFIPAGWKASFSQALGANGLGSGNAAIASHQFDKINNDQILSDIQQFVATGGANTRINQTLEKIVQAASGIDKTASPEARAAMLKAARAEIANKNATQQNVVGGNQQYQPIPVQTSATAQTGNMPIIKTQAAYDALPVGAVYVESDGNRYTKK